MNPQDILKSRKTGIMQKYRQTNYIRRIYIPYADSLHLFYMQNITKITHRWTRLKTYRIRACLPQLMAGVTQRDLAERTRFQPQIQSIEVTRISSSN